MITREQICQGMVTSAVYVVEPEPQQVRLWLYVQAKCKGASLS